MGKRIKGEPRPDIIALKLRCMNRNKRPCEMWHETPAAFSLYDKFGKVDSRQKENVRGLITTSGEVPFSYTPKARVK